MRYFKPEALPPQAAEKVQPEAESFDGMLHAHREKVVERDQKTRELNERALRGMLGDAVYERQFHK